MIGQSFTNIISPMLSNLSAQTEIINQGQSEMPKRNAFNNENRNSYGNAFFDFANAILRAPSERGEYSLRHRIQQNQYDHNIDPFLTIRQLAPGARNNFGIPQGEG